MTTLPKALRARLDRRASRVARTGRGVGQRRRRHGEVAVGARRRRPGRDRADALPGPGDRVRVQPGRLRDGLRLLRHRAGRLRPPPHRRRDRRAGRAGRAARRATPVGGCRTSCSWGWASRSPTTTARGPRSSACTTTSASSARHLTVSTVGIVPGIRRLAGERLPVNLAVSLHAANDELARRARADQPPLPPRRRCVAACHDYIAAKSRRLSFEWALIDGVNDRRRRRERAARRSPARCGPT